MSHPRPAPPPPPVAPATRLLWAPWMAAKRAVLRRRLRRPVFETIRGRSFAVWPGVFNPVVFRTGRFLAEFIATSPLLEPLGAGATALDVGTGCGVLGIFAATRGYQVTAVDVVPEAVACARANALLNTLAVDVQQGDLFAPVAGRTFDLVLFSLPKFRGTPATTFERSWRSPDVIDRLAAGLPGMLKPGGKAYFVLTSHGDCAGMLDGLAQAGLAVERVLWRHFGVETLAIYSATAPNRSSSAAVSS
ncbi:methyltransferase [Nitrospirillum pindoramense]|uniref:Methylase of polypeptide subunit release factors n=1 Tax=Nitrospirillum amazonense TaxID=28077 RepID=A0A560H0B7_9PROT|nr:methyltransferase [Nitrospirillum amazonense]TWB39561.1 methylase of polypeptide subunit release factors [Nitrospirillum amazonense]